MACCRNRSRRTVCMYATHMSALLLGLALYVLMVASIQHHGDIRNLDFLKSIPGAAFYPLAYCGALVVLLSSIGLYGTAQNEFKIGRIVLICHSIFLSVLEVLLVVLVVLTAVYFFHSSDDSGGFLKHIFYRYADYNFHHCCNAKNESASRDPYHSKCWLPAESDVLSHCEQKDDFRESLYENYRRIMIYFTVVCSLAFCVLGLISVYQRRHYQFGKLRQRAMLARISQTSVNSS